MLRETGACWRWPSPARSSAGARPWPARGGEGVRWDLHGISRLDTIGALLIWQAWGERLPERVRWAAGQQDVFNALSLNKGGTRDVPAKEDPWGWLRAVGMPCSARPAMAARCSSCWDS